MCSSPPPPPNINHSVKFSRGLQQSEKTKPLLFIHRDFKNETQILKLPRTVHEGAPNVTVRTRLSLDCPHSKAVLVGSKEGLCMQKCLGFTRYQSIVDKILLMIHY